jgi:hypothetical protein
MQDAVIGTAVLSELEPDQWWLFICCLSADRKHVDQTAVRATEEGKQHKHEAGKPIWTYKFISESRIACKPSVWWKYGPNGEETYFHNTYDWETDVCCCPAEAFPGDVADKMNSELRQQWRDTWINKV